MTKKITRILLSMLMLLTVCVNQLPNVKAVDEYLDLAKEALISVSSTNGDNSATHINDGNDLTQWESKSGVNESVIFDLKKRQLIDIVQITWGMDFAFKYKVQISDDNKTYKDMIYHEEGTGGTDEWPMPEGTSGRFVRIFIEQAGTGSIHVNIKDAKILQLKQVVPEGPTNIALHKDAYASGVEQNLDRLGPKGAFDGDMEDMTNGRWSSGNINVNPQWIYVNLGKKYSFSSIQILWEKAHGTAYELQYSNTGNDDWETIVKVSDGDGGWDKHVFDSITAQYVRLYVTTGVNMGSGGAISVMEMEIFEEKVSSVTLDDIVAKFALPEILPTDTKMPSLSFEDGQFTADIFCSDTDIVVEDNGNIHKPLVDKEVLVTYIVKDTRTKQQQEARNIAITIPGKNKQSASNNPIPTTVPTIQEWFGQTGTFQLSANTVIVYKQAELKKAAEITKADIKDLFDLDVQIAEGNEQAGDIVLTYDQADPSLGKEGYEMEIADVLTIRASTYNAVFSGTRSVLQGILSSDKALQIAKGSVRDYPKYEHRKFMLDVARKYTPMWYLEDFVKYASWFKFSEIQIHLNDSSYNGHARFRLESDIPGLTATDGFYTKEEYREFQTYADEYGIDIISEFDTPAHSEVFNNLNPDLKFDATHLDIRLDSPKKNTVYQFIADLYDEYLGGDNPVFTSDYFNVGLDEYNSNYKEDMTQYTKYVTELVHDKYGKTPMAWASMGCLDSSKTTLPTYPIMDAWANYAIDLKALFKQGYQLINATNKYGYVVPGGNNGYPNFAKTEEIYNTFSAGTFRDKNNAGVDVAEGHPQIAGGSISLWNDRGIFSGISTYDVFKRQQSIMPVYAQKFWYGDNEAKSYQQFQKDVDTVGIAPNNTLNHDIESKTDQVYDIDFEDVKVDGTKMKIEDTSSNHFDVEAVNGEIVNGNEGKALSFNGNTTLSLQQPALSYPYTVSFDLHLNTYGDKEIVLFQQELPKVACDDVIDTGDQISKIYIDKTTHKLAYKRDQYTFIFDYVVPVDTWVKLAMTCNEKTTRLYANGKLVATLNGPLLTNSGSKWQDSATIYLPLETIGVNVKGQMDNLKVFNRELDEKEIADIQEIVAINNLVLNKPTLASSQYNVAQGPEKAVDGIEDMSSRWASLRTHAQWMQVDLGAIYKVNKIYMNWEDAFGQEFKFMGSLDGKEWFEIKHITDGKKGVSVYDNLGQVATRYIKVQGIVAANNAKYGYSLIEMMVYEKSNDELLQLLAEIEEKLLTLQVGDKNGQIDEDVYQAFVAHMKSWKELADSSQTISDDDLIALKTQAQKGYANVVKAVVTVDRATLAATIEEKEAMQESSWTIDSWKALQKVLLEARTMMDNQDVGQKAIDAMVAKLQAVALVLRGNTTNVEQLLADYKDSVEAMYTPASWAVYKIALEAAKALVKDASNATQADVDAAYATLKESHEKLVVKIVNKEFLESAVNKANDLLNSGALEHVADKVMAQFKYYLGEAVAIVAKETATQEEVMEAWLNLATAMHYLDFTANKEELINLIVICEGLDLDQYQEVGKEEFKTALKEAIHVRDSQDVLDITIIKAHDALLDAKSKLRVIESYQTIVLQFQIATANHALQQAEQYIHNQSWDIFLEALRNAESVLASPQSQAQIDEACKKLAEAYENIRLKPSEEKLGQLKAFMEKVQLVNYARFTTSDGAFIKQTLQTVTRFYEERSFTQQEFDHILVDMQKVEKLLDETTQEQPSIDKPNADNASDSQSKHSSVSTGDSTSLGALMFLCIVSGLYVFTLRHKRRKQQR